jgi:hypothetical protein
MTDAPVFLKMIYASTIGALIVRISSLSQALMFKSKTLPDTLAIGKKSKGK